MFCTLSFSAIIVLKNGEKIEEVENITVTNTNVTYLINGQEQSIPTKDVEAYLDDNGNYTEIRVNPFAELVENETSDNNSSVDLSKEFSADLTAFYNAVPQEAQTAMNAQVYLHNHSAKIKDLDQGAILTKALEAYVKEKYDHNDGITAIRAYYSVIIDNVEKIKSSKKK